jgi:hypothetical protein
MAANPVLAAILAAKDKVERYGLPMTLENVRANIDYSSLTIGDAVEATRRYTNAQVPTVLKSLDLIIVDTVTRERKGYWESTRSELGEQLRLKVESATYDSNKILVDKAVISLLEEKERELGYEPYAGLFQDEINRIYAMHNVTPPGAAA